MIIYIGALNPRLRISVLGEIWYSFVVRIRPRVPVASTQTVDLSQTPHAGVTSVPVPTRLSRHSHQLQLRLDKKKAKQTENSARMHFIEGKNNHLYISGRSGTVPLS